MKDRAPKVLRGGVPKGRRKVLSATSATPGFGTLEKRSRMNRGVVRGARWGDLWPHSILGAYRGGQRRWKCPPGPRAARDGPIFIWAPRKRKTFRENFPFGPTHRLGGRPLSPEPVIFPRGLPPQERVRAEISCIPLGWGCPLQSIFTREGFVPVLRAPRSKSREGYPFSMAEPQEDWSIKLQNDPLNRTKKGGILGARGGS
ncbi:hypothetical protein GWK47_050447 [Chionoecetes opilio]|uniref:Uncharacterized protein n=1 Tax=Chionoecetes opilio TaxID=41210 RepID=A0A8J4YA06_CHIOP|nr:hypothetical protein GWK47_050447 [Chionoecetes opilio]